MLKDKNITKIEKKETVFVCFLGFIFMEFLARKLIYAIIMLFNFVFGLLFEQDHLLNLIILGVYAKI